MALLVPQGKLSWPASASPDAVGYAVYQASNGSPLNYDSPHVDVGNVLEAVLPIAGLPAGEGAFNFAVATIDAAGNRSDLRQLPDPVLIDLTPPIAPESIAFSRDF